MLEARDLDLVLSGRRILSAVSLTLHPGVLTAVIGPNGAGKSMLLSLLSGLRQPTGGDVRLNGCPLADLGPGRLARHRAVLEQSPRAASATRVYDLAMLAIPREIPPREAEAMARTALAAAGLAPLATRRISELSGGERHRAHMARVHAQHLAGRALGAGEVLMLDEPTASLDLTHQAAILEVARSTADSGAAVLVILHDIGLAAAFADRIAVLRAGHLIAKGPPRTVLTPETLAAVYGLPVSIAELPGGHIGVLPQFRAPITHPSATEHARGNSPCLSP